MRATSLCFLAFFFSARFAATAFAFTAVAPLPVAPDIMVAADGSTEFRTIQSALESIPKNNRERRVILVRDGVYHEKVRIDAPFVTLRGESRAGTRIEFAQAADAFHKQNDSVGLAVVNITAPAHDFVLENLTVKNTHGVIGLHAFAVFGLADKTVIIDCDVLSQGADTLALWRGRNQNAEATAGTPGLEAGGRSYQARLNICGSVDFVCPRGWSYLADSTITQVNPNATAAIWHDGSKDPDMKFVLRGCRFDGPPNWILSRHHRDAQYFLIDCCFSERMRDMKPYRVIYPLEGNTPTDADLARNRELDPVNRWGERVYYFNCHRDGGDYAWHADNLAAAPGSPAASEITPRWTFAGTWDPERTDHPAVCMLQPTAGGFLLRFTEDVTVKGRPRLVLEHGAKADYVSGSGSASLQFSAAHPAAPLQLDFTDGAIVATEATATLRLASPHLPRADAPCVAKADRSHGDH